MNKADIKQQIDLTIVDQKGAVTPEKDKTLRKLFIDNTLNKDDDKMPLAAIIAGESEVLGLLDPKVLKSAIVSLVSTALSNFVVDEAGYIKNYSSIENAVTEGVQTGARTFIADIQHRFNGSTWEADAEELTGPILIGLIDGVLGSSWKQGGVAGGGNGYLENITGIENAPIDGVPNGALRLIDGKFHKFNSSAGDNGVWEDATDELDGPDLLPLLNAALGGETWQGNSGGSSASFDYTLAAGGFVATDRANWLESGGTLTSIKDIKTAQLFIPSDPGDLLYDTANSFFSTNNTDTGLDLNDGDSGFLSPGAGVFTLLGALRFEGNNASRHIKFQNNAGGNTYKFTSSGLEIRNNGTATETIPFAMANGTAYFYAIQRMHNGKHRFYLGSSETDIQFIGESVGISATDLGGLSELSLGETETASMLLMFFEYLTEPTINQAFQKVKADNLIS